VRTKYGTRTELEAAVRRVHAAGFRVYLDVVFNHKRGADATERVRGPPVDPDNRNRTVGEERELDTWTVFDFHGRGDRYSSLRRRWRHFDAVDYDRITGSIGTIYRLREKRFEAAVSGESRTPVVDACTGGIRGGRVLGAVDISVIPTANRTRFTGLTGLFSDTNAKIVDKPRRAQVGGREYH